jgi:hypothetical protein
MVPLQVYPIGQTDEWHRPIYKDSDNRLYVDVNLGDGPYPYLHTTTPYGEPDSPVGDFEIVPPPAEMD